MSPCSDAYIRTRVRAQVQVIRRYRAPLCAPARIVGEMTAEHWDRVYGSKAADETSWFQADPATSLRLLSEHAPPPASVIDVGAGTSVLADRLLDGGWSDVTILDVSAEALAVVRERLGNRVRTLVADLLTWTPTRTFDAWHDRAVFHFLTDPTDRDRYVSAAIAALSPGGVMVIGTFAPDGPEQCSGLPTARYDVGELADVFAGFRLEHSEREEHVTPWATVQPFTWAVLRRADSLVGAYKRAVTLADTAE